MTRPSIAAPFVATLIVALSTSAQASDFSHLIECRDGDWLRADPAAALDRAAQAGYDCRLREQQHIQAVDCRGTAATRAFGQIVREFSLARTPDGGSVMSVAFTSSPSSLAARIDRERAAAAGSPLASAELDQREDGVAELRCRVPGHRGQTGTLAGELDFRGQQPLPAMRVCAAPVRDPERPVCVQTRTGQRDYVIEQLPAGDYYVTAFATEANPNRLFGVYGSPLQDCPAGSGRCADQRLQPVTVVPGNVRSGIDPNTLVPQLPAPLKTPAPGTF